MTPFRSISLRFLAPLALVAVVGCGDPEDSISLVSVEGTVTRDGALVTGASVSFLPAPGNADQTPGAGTTDSSGMFAARFRNRPGLAVGHYRVIIAPEDEGADVEVDSSVEEAFKDDPIMLREMKRAGAAGGSRKKAKAPAKRAEFEIDVPADGLKRDFDMNKTGGEAAPAAKPEEAAK